MSFYDDIADQYDEDATGDLFDERKPASDMTLEEYGAYLRAEYPDEQHTDEAIKELHDAAIFAAGVVERREAKRTAEELSAALWGMGPMETAVASPSRVSGQSSRPRGGVPPKNAIRAF